MAERASISSIARRLVNLIRTTETDRVRPLGCRDWNLAWSARRQPLAWQWRDVFNYIGWCVAHFADGNFVHIITAVFRKWLMFSACMQDVCVNAQELLFPHSRAWNICSPCMWAKCILRVLLMDYNLPKKLYHRAANVISLPQLPSAGINWHQFALYWKKLSMKIFYAISLSSDKLISLDACSIGFCCHIVKRKTASHSRSHTTTGIA